MKKISNMKPLLVSAMLLLAVTGKAQSHGNRLSLGVGALYERGFDVTLAMEHETKNHNAWEYFANGYVSGQRMNLPDMSPKNHSGTTIAHGD
jgi:hypothetical protein